MKHHKIMVTGLALTLAVGLLAACDSAKEQEITAETAPVTLPATESAELTEAPTEEAATTEAETEEETKTTVATRAPKEEEEKGGCGSVVSIGAVVAIIALGVVCTKKKD